MLGEQAASASPHGVRLPFCTSPFGKGGWGIFLLMNAALFCCVTGRTLLRPCCCSNFTMKDLKGMKLSAMASVAGPSGPVAASVW
jgi:hypothetical protein